MRYVRGRLALAALLSAAAAVALAGSAFAQPAKIKVASTLREIFDNLPLYVAAEGGLYRKHGLEVEGAVHVACRW